MNVHVDRDLCVASGQCSAIAPAVFDQRESDGVVVLLTAVPPIEVAADVEHAASACPAQAIHVTR
jgi:ferredoxin